jgi:hypothetical protein
MLEINNMHEMNHEMNYGVGGKIGEKENGRKIVKLHFCCRPEEFYNCADKL